MDENNFRICEEVQHNRVFVAEGRRGGGAKNASIYALSGHERIEMISIKILRSIPRGNARVPGGKCAKLLGPRALFGANISRKIVINLH